MEYKVVKETRLNEGEKEIWYLVEPKNKFFKFFHNITILGYDPYSDKEEAIRTAKLRSEGNWNRRISRKRILRGKKQ